MLQRQSYRERLAWELGHSIVRDVTFTGDGISLTFDGTHLSNRIVIVPHEEWVASWSRTDRVVYIDDDVPVKYHKYLAIHETVEKYLNEKYGLDPNSDAHIIAEKVEKQYFLKMHTMTEWQQYSDIVEIIHRKELA
jgi:glycosylphosphatidylinositol transamidase (GPIT) subunit GPI8